MQRILIMTVLAVLLTSTAGATTAMAAPTGNAAVRQFDVAISGGGTGTLTINPAQQTFVFNGEGARPTQMYYLSISVVDGTLGRVAIQLGATAAKADGSIHMKGQCTATLKQLDNTEKPPWVFVSPRVGGDVYTSIHAFELYNDLSGWFVAKLACYYSTDGGVTWHESGHSSGITAGYSRHIELSDLGVPEGALVKIHAIIVAGKDRTGSQVFEYHHYVDSDPSTHLFVAYYTSGTTLNPTLQLWGSWNN